MDVLDRLERMKGLWEGSSLSLNPPASAAKLAETERIIGVELPDEVRRAYLRFDGTTRRYYTDLPVGPTMFFLPGFDWVSLDRMVELWLLMKETSEILTSDGTWPDIASESEDVWGDAEYQKSLQSWTVGWLPKWVPIGDNEQHCKVFVDLDPAPAGIYGQLIYTQLDTFETEVAASSFNSYLDRFLTAIEIGLMVPTKDSNKWKRAGDGYSLRRLSDIGI